MEAKISTEKVVVDGIKCRKILGWSGILAEKDLPGAYLANAPNFCLRSYNEVGRHAVTHGQPDWSIEKNCGPDAVICRFPPGLPKIDVGIYGICLTPGGILTEDAFQALIIWMKRSGSRLAKMRKKEKQTKPMVAENEMIKTLENFVNWAKSGKIEILQFSGQSGMGGTSTFSVVYSEKKAAEWQGTEEVVI